LERKNDASDGGGPSFFAFVRCDFNEPLNAICTKVHQFANLPQLAHARSRTIKRQEGVIKFRSGHLFPARELGSTDEMLKWINKHTKRDVGRYQDIFQNLQKLSEIGVKIILPALALIILFVVLLRYLPTKLTMVPGSIFIQFICLSGISWNLINKTGFSFYDTSGKIFKHDNRTQNLSEGLITSGIIVATAISLYLAATSHKKRGFMPQVVKSFLGSPVGSISLLIIAFCLVYTLEDLYRTYKRAWLPTSVEFVGKDMARGSLMVDRQNSRFNEDTDRISWLEVIESSYPVALISYVSSFPTNPTPRILRWLKKVRKMVTKNDMVKSIHGTYVSTFDSTYDILCGRR